MKLHEGCSQECLVCGAKSCDPMDHDNSFARASKEKLIEKYNSDHYTDEEKEKLRVWLKVQFDYDVK